MEIIFFWVACIGVLAASPSNILPPEDTPLESLFYWETWKFSEFYPIFERRGEEGVQFLLDKLKSDKRNDRHRAALILSQTGDNTYLSDIAEAYDRDVHNESYHSYAKALNHIGTPEAAELMASNLALGFVGGSLSYLKRMGHPEAIPGLKIFIQSLEGDESEAARSTRNHAQETLEVLQEKTSGGNPVHSRSASDGIGRTTNTEVTSATSTRSEANPILWLSSIVGVCAIVGIAVVLLRSRLA